jgi:hypothetical protein
MSNKTSPMGLSIRKVGNEYVIFLDGIEMFHCKYYLKAVVETANTISKR